MISQASGSAYAEFNNTKVQLLVEAWAAAMAAQLTSDCPTASAAATLAPPNALPSPSLHSQVMVGVYGPRQSERKVGYSEQGRISVDVKLATFATRQRGVFGQVGRHTCNRCWAAARQAVCRACWAAGQRACLGLRLASPVTLAAACSSWCAPICLFRQTPEERELSALLSTALEAATNLASFPKATADV